MNETVRDFVLPTLVLAVICLVVSAALSGTYGITNPIIEENNRIAEQQALTEVLPAGDSFVAAEGSLPDGVSAFYTAENGAGCVVRVSPSGYGGPISMMVGLNTDGAISGIKVLENSETQGIGSKVMDESYTSQYAGKSGADEVDAIGGATISSTGLKTGIRTAMEAAAALGKGAN
ncbi:MAG: FMN-binding protein [Provencibacterium sp.]|jgi:electron transport complex protein RnfG|nr:FMN-binding protein [Provencibacterium sp.]